MKYIFILITVFFSYKALNAQVPLERIDRTRIQRQVERGAERTPEASPRQAPATQRPERVNRPSGNAYHEKYKLISTYIPEPDDAIKYVNVNFNIFQDYHGENNFSPLTHTADSVRLVRMLDWVNQIYARQPQCPESSTYNSDPPPGVVVHDLPHKYIQFRLNGIYVYRDAYEGEGLWKSNSANDLLARIAQTDSSRLEQLNICFTEKYYLGRIRRVDVEDGGRGYAHPMVDIRGGGGSGATAFARVADGSVTQIVLVDAGEGYTSPPEVVISGGNGRGAEAQAIINERTGSLMRVDIVSPGTGYNFTEIHLKGGGGTGAAAYVQEIRRGRITRVGVHRQGHRYTEEPEVVIKTDTEGRGAAFSFNVRGATGFTTTPDLRGERDMFIVQKSRWKGGNKEGDYASATNLAHELGHVLDLLHTYQGGSETSNENHHDYLWDVFGRPFSGYHIVDWGKDACASPTDRITNNLMGGNKVSQYTSPLQIGKMHRALHIYTVKRYTDCHCDKNRKWVIDSDEEWDFDIKLYNPLHIKSGTLTINSRVEMPDNCSVVVEPGATLIIGEEGVLTGGCRKLWDGYLHIKKDASFSVMPGGAFLMEDMGKFIID